MYLFPVDFEQSSEVFSDVRKLEPYQMTGIDVYSHILFVMVSDMYSCMHAGIMLD